MRISKPLLSYLRSAAEARPLCQSNGRTNPLRDSNAFSRRPLSFTQRRFARAPAEEPDFVSLVDGPAQLVRQKRRHGPGLIVLALIPAISFGLGCWQVQRLGWKTDLMARFEDRLVRDPLPLPPQIDPKVISEFDYRRVYATGRLRHDQEMLIGPRLHDGADGYLVITPLDRGDKGSKVLVNRGWIAKAKKEQRSRPESMTQGEVMVQGLLREPWKKNMFTPDNQPQFGEFYFPDVEMLAGLTGSQPVWIEQTMRPDVLMAMDREAKGIPIGRAAEVNLRNNHTQYIFTWFSLSIATSIMLWMVVKKPPSGLKSRVRQSKEW